MIRPLKVIANALTAGFHLITHRALPRPVESGSPGPNDTVMLHHFLSKAQRLDRRLGETGRKRPSERARLGPSAILSTSAEGIP